MPQDAQCHVWDFTEPADGLSVDDLHRRLRPIAKKYCFQLERGRQISDAHPEGYLHYQGRVSLYQKCRPNELISKWHDWGFQSNVSPTSGDVARKGDNFYVMKEDTRVDGPWTDKNFEEPRPTLPTVTKMEAHGLFPWQADLLDKVKEYDDRTIHIVIDAEGNNGKSALPKWVWQKRLGQPIPPMNSMEDIVQFTMSFPDKLYLIDMPRAMKKRKLHEFYSGIEMIKNGMLYDKRYHGKFMYIPEPNIIVFTNTPPKKCYLSLDRWKMWKVVDQQLVVYKYPARPA